ncbi:MAG: hypothetical protein JW751_19195 [Polyangiaceae bacterium]|nr:hypothetical protein [Polyangiaceae bacterium]
MRSWPRTLPAVLVAGAVLTCALLHGRAMTALIESALLDDPGPAPATLSASPATTAPTTTKEPLAEVILRRNPFDSRTGPLAGVASPVASVAPPVHPLVAPVCEDLAVASTAVARDPRWSSAIVQAKGEPHGKLCRVGDSVAGHQVRYIGQNSRRGSPAVWFLDHGVLCQAFVFGKPAPRPAKRATKGRRSARSGDTARPPRKRRPR